MNSIAADLLQSRPPRASLKSSNEIIADLKETLSDFNSCHESLGELSGSSDEGQENLEHAFKTVNDKKREKKKKRKLALTPGKEQFLKRANTQASPQ